MGALLRDLRVACRSLARAPGHAAIVVLVLALGIAANATVFSFVSAVYLRPVPWRDPGNLVVLRFTSSTEKDEGVSETIFSQMKGELRTLALARHAAWSYPRHTPEGRERSDVARVTADLLPLLGVPLVRGRNFTAEEEREGGPPAAILSHDAWQSWFLGNEDVVGRTVTLDGVPRHVVGVLGPEQKAALPFDVLLPVAVHPKNWLAHSVLIGRLRDGASIADARSEIDAFNQRMLATHPRAPRDSRFVIRGVPEHFGRELAPSLRLALGAVVLVQLIVVFNTASLLLARALRRKRELAIRAALGAGWSALVRNLLSEALVLATAGTASGIVLGACAIAALQNHSAAVVGYGGARGGLGVFGAITLDHRVLSYALGLGLVSGIIAGIVPALGASGRDLLTPLKEGEGASRPHGRRMSLRDGLVTVQVALALVLASGTALMTKSVLALDEKDLGFRKRGLIWAQISAPLPPDDGEARMARLAKTRERLASIPGVQAATYGKGNQLGVHYHSRWEAPGGRTDANGQARGMYSLATPESLEVLGVRLLEGRFVGAADRATSGQVAVVDDLFAKQVFGGQALGKRIRRIGEVADHWREIVGVVRHGLEIVPTGIDEDHKRVYIPFAQAEKIINRNAHATLFVRTDRPVASILPEIRREIRAVNPSVWVFEAMSMDQRYAERTWVRRALATSLGVLSALALTLAALGLYALLTQRITQRAREMAIRIAVGAPTRHVVDLVLTGAARLVGVGLVIGAVGVVASSRVLRTFLYDVQPLDPLMLGGTALFLAAVTFVAAYVPARRSSRSDPMSLLRHE